ncbi:MULTISPECIES: HNH endonuclease signature motif containing protein [Pseudomonas]|uniref:HNH endonuclease signature motif containing protein n=1 Tax=Pseudomonas TaxID=286 RepID=UPI0002A32A7C|nr:MULTISPECIES: HNH endonuclease signature motif containing protein [Pseudomonas]UNY90626.1 HNH endonuclease [Pseudomonas sp. M1]WRT83508.1 HNH endonuclease signature motif containing protein [Pseudomonas citronellolis]
MNAITIRAECIEHAGGKMRTGYGRTQYKGRQILAHRLAYCMASGIEPEQIKGVVIRHKCDNPSCVNPDHLEPGTTQENMNDMTDRGRRVRGELVGNSKLTEEQINAIRDAYRPRSKDANQYALARQHGVTQSLISMILNGKRWEHLNHEAKA